MSQNSRKITNSLQGMNAKAGEVLSGKVISVDENSATMVVQLTNDTVNVENVMLNAVSHNINGLLLIPTVGSDVIIGNVDGGGEEVLLKASNITKAVITIGNMKLTMDGEKYDLKIGGDTLGKILDDLIQQVLDITVTTSTGPSGTLVNAVPISDIKTRLGNFLKI